MSAVVKLASKLPGDPEINGLDAWRDRLEEEPDELLIVVAYLDVQKVTIDTDTGAHVPTVRVRRLEPLGRMNHVSQTVRDAVAAAEEERTGRTPLPFETVVYSSADPDGDEFPEDRG